ncbi:MAG: hypothetical protein J6Y80_00580 [Victivallales bacterium]|nr:hypothetical protein [Victivallales bacterium]
MPNLLFVCSSNRTRSPLAAALFAQFAREGGLLGWSVDSAGLRAQHGLRVAENVDAVLAARGLHPLRLGTQVVTSKLITEADLILCMTRDQMKELTKKFVSARNKTKTVMSILREETDVFDPNKGDSARYEACVSMMEPALRTLVERLK